MKIFPDSNLNNTTVKALDGAKQAEFELEIAPPASGLLENSATGTEDDGPSADDGTADNELISDEADDNVVGAAAEAVAVIAPASSSSSAVAVAPAAAAAAAAQPATATTAALANGGTGVVNQNDPNPINRYCTCAAASCKCCREFSLPIVPIRGPGCATLKYLEDDKMLVTVKYGDIVLTSRTISGRQSTPICIPLPGGYSRFCGRVYGISREEENFKACLGLELRAEDEVEAALRVSCFKFGPKGLATTEAEPLPPVVKDEDDDEEDDDFLGLGGETD